LLHLKGLKGIYFDEKLSLKKSFIDHLKDLFLQQMVQKNFCLNLSPGARL